MRNHATLPVAALIAVGVGAGAAISTAPGLAETSYAAEPTATQTSLNVGTADEFDLAAVRSTPIPLISASLVPSLALPSATATAAETPAPTVVIDENSGPSRWKGKTLRGPDGSKLPPEVTRWANIVVAVMDEQKIPRKYLPGILAQIKQESTGNPKAVNNYDSNAAAGTPSKGLLQVIAPTYQTNAKPGFKNLRYQTVPYTNIWASLRYVKKAYGMDKFQSWNQGANHSY